MDHFGDRSMFDQTLWRSSESGGKTCGSAFGGLSPNIVLQRVLYCSLIYHTQDQDMDYKLGPKPYRPRTKENTLKWRCVRRELRTGRDRVSRERLMEVGGEEFIYYLTGRGSLLHVDD